ncbi:MBL fold metallo-hydrolase [Klebsiella sp. BIGb0407]|uniref:MBL fold metallo-hydrolase n=1 Tax=Klebsiella sp. BIGb0407 TaxID=2940603 RepID=UPI00216AA7E1|nr:MBL fold metallo-hydrolase [Klebsiella sp. BIGb0407]MCS3429821.1 L-ascorbate metabolism protein UlaG (beta-lactamase superfamily) [Klebsiella sp. BIGb0407]
MTLTKKLIKKPVQAIRAICAGLLPRTFPIYPESPHFDKEKERFVNPLPTGGVAFKDGISALFEMLQGVGQYGPKKPLPIIKPDWSLFLQNDDINRFIWFGHSTLLMRVGQQTVAVDPVLGKSVSPLVVNMRRFQEPAASLDEWPQVDMILLSHNHYDHLEENTLKQFAGTSTRFIVPLGVGENLKPLGIQPDKITELDWWQSLNVKDVSYTLVPAWHNTGRGLRDKDKSFWGGYIIQQADDRVYYSGDSTYGSHFAEIARRFPNISLAFIENGQYDRRWPDNHMTPELTVQAAVDVQAYRVVPIHWGAYTIAFHPWNEPVRRSIPLLRQKGIQPLTPYQGQVFDKNTVTEEWYLALE